MQRTGLALDVGEPCLQTAATPLPPWLVLEADLRSATACASRQAPPATICPSPMDIHNWLQTTADRQPPDEEEHPGIPDFLKPHGPAETKRRERHSTRKRPSSEPPSSERHHHRRKRHRPATRSSSSPDHARKLRPPATASRSSSHASQRRHVREGTPEKEVPSKSFERRARHKTRPDRYEAKPKERSDGRKARDEPTSRSQGRKSRKNGDIAKATGTIQSFQLKNGRKDKRLTVRLAICAMAR